MSQEQQNMSMRKFLKQVGVTSQQEIEKSIRKGLEEGSLTPGKLAVKVVLTMPATGLEHVVTGEIEAGGTN